MEQAILPAAAFQRLFRTKHDSSTAPLARLKAKVPEMWRGRDEHSRRMGSGRSTGVASGSKQLGSTTIRLSGSIGPCKPVRLPVQPPDAGKPHVRWCGRVPGRNLRHSTRSGLAAPLLIYGNDAPGAIPYFDFFQDCSGYDVYHRYVVRGAVGGE